MKRLSALLLAGASMLGTAYAADLYTKAAPMVQAAPPITNWSGLYVGGIVGAGFGGTDWNVTGTDPVSGAFLAATGLPTSTSVNKTGVVGGGEVGYNYEVYNAFLLGVFANFQAADISSATTLAGHGHIFETVNTSVNTLGSVQARLGYVVSPSIMLAIHGGFGFGGVNQEAQAGVGGTTIVDAFQGDTQFGWAAGAEANWMFMPNWIARVDYTHFGLGSTEMPIGLAGLNFKTSTTWSVDEVSFGLIRKF